MTRPTAAQLALARSMLPVRRVASTPIGPNLNKNQFEAMLQNASSISSPRLETAKPGAPSAMYHAPMLWAAAPPAISSAGGPAPISRSEILNNAQQLMSIPYVWGANLASGLDCSAFVSKVWGISRHTTDSLSSVASAISKDELKAGDALNLTTGRDPDGAGHVRLFDRWANPEHTQMYVYEETPPRSLHHVINWDPRYQPMRRNNVGDA